MSMWWTCLAVGGVTVWTTPGEPRHAGSAVPCAAFHQGLCFRALWTSAVSAGLP